ncbi:hypothetical protein [Tenacibaculum sp. 190524A05c]|uniref:hypothetical protein n=1 Tax=Tenacibaculum platacis TaxID=3137852 RepID=UPI0032B1038C
MIYLYPENLVVQQAIKMHANNIVCLVYKRLTGIGCNDSSCKVCPETRKVKHELSVRIQRYLTRERIDEIIRAKPDFLWNVLERFYLSATHFRLSEFNDYINFLSIKESDRTIPQKRLISRFKKLNIKLLKVFSYSTFIKKEKKYNAYILSSKLDKNTCTYCNRNYTNTVVSENGEKIIRPQFDHWYPKKKLSLLALSFYNLIPSCSTCNTSIKGDQIFKIGVYIHPYLDKINNKDFKFSYRYSSKTKSGFAIKLLYPNNDHVVRRTMRSYKIEEVYNAHTEELKELLKIKQAYSERYLSILSSNTYNGLNISQEELYRLAFGVYYDEKDFSKRPFSKMKKDILKELNIINEGE